MVLTGKVILIISSEAWGKIFISKHHYALTLAQLGNIVFFLNPPDFGLPYGTVRIENYSLEKNLSIVTYRPFFPWILKFHAKWLFNILIKLQLKKILKRLKAKLDIVWDFSCSFLYNDLSVFNAGLRIFHPVDRLSADARNKRSDILFSVSPLILKDYAVKNVPAFLINHGISEEYKEIAEQPPIPVDYSHKTIKIAYIGNLVIPTLDRDVLLRIISGNTHVNFTFIGPYSNKQNNVSSDFNSKDKEFIDTLRSFPNVSLTGILSTRELADKIQEFDIFFICYKSTGNYRCDNSHKILEYLSTGKVVVSTPILFYQDSDLLQMSKGVGDFENVFTTVIRNLDFYNSVEKMTERKNFAKNNTYRDHLKKIEQLITQSVKSD